MKKMKTREYEKDCRIVGKFNNSTLAIARAVTKEILSGESMHVHSRITEYYIFIRGRAEMMINNDTIVVFGGDVLVVEPGEKHKITKVIEEIDYITIRDSAEDDKTIDSATG